MKAAVYTKAKSGRVLEMKDLERPVPKNDEVVIRVCAASVNPLDWRMKSQRPGVDVAEILYGFITRDYRRTAEVHFEAGYVPANHSVENFAQAIRAIGEPIHNRTAEDISMARLLTLLFEVTGLFDMRTRPELLLLQKTMVVVEGVARSLDPKLDMWSTAEPVVREWMTRYLGPAGKLEGAMQGVGEIGRFASHVPGLLTRGARLLDQLDDVTRDGLMLSPQTIAEIDKAETRRNRGSVIALWAIAALLLWIVLLLIR